MAQPALKTESLTRVRRGVPALNGLSLAFEPGLLTAVVGPAGSGKTALMRCLAGLDRTPAASITLDGAPIGHLPARRRGFGVVRQPDRLLGHLNLAENVALPLRRMTRAARQTLLHEMLELTQLTEAAAWKPCQAEPPEIRRALLARAAVFGPPVLLLDDPFAGAEEAELPVLVSLLRQLHGMLGATTVLATRSFRHALPVADRVAVLRGGALEQFATPDMVFREPATDFVATSFGEANRLEGIIDTAEDDTVFIRLACGPVVEARRGAACVPGARCVMVLRPEHIAIAPGTAADMGDGALDATLLEIQFWGDTYRLRLLIGSGAELVVRRPTLAGLRGLAPGCPAAVAWQPHQARIFLASPQK